MWDFLNENERATSTASMPRRRLDRAFLPLSLRAAKRSEWESGPGGEGRTGLPLFPLHCYLFPTPLPTTYFRYPSHHPPPTMYPPAVQYKVKETADGRNDRDADSFDIAEIRGGRPARRT